MMGERRVMQEALVYGFSLERHVPSDHLLRKIDRFVDPSGLRAPLALMFAVKSKGAVEGPLGETAVGEKGYSCAELGAERETTVNQTLIRGLFTAFRVFVSGLSSV